MGLREYFVKREAGPPEWERRIAREADLYILLFVVGLLIAWFLLAGGCA